MKDRRALTVKQRRVITTGRALGLAALVAASAALSGCAALGTFNEVLRGVSKEDANWVREAARKNVVNDRGVAEINATNVCGERALHLAIQRGLDDILLVLIQEGADVNLPTEIAREASMCESLERSTSVDYAPAGYPPLHYAILENRPDFAELLLFAGADPNQRTSSGATAVDLIGSKSGFETISVFSNAPLHLSARTGNLGRVRELLSAGADPNATLDGRGTTPVEEALLGRAWPVVDYLLENGGGQQETISSPDIALAIEDYLAENTPSATTRQLERLQSR